MGETEKLNCVDETYIRPKEAERKLKTAQKMNHAAYLYGVTGTGKTALVEDMLKRRRYQYYSAEKASPEEIIVKKDGKNHIVVLDDLYAVTSTEQREAYSVLIEGLLNRRDVWLVLISRAPIPRWLFPLYAKYIFFIIEEEDFLLTREQQNIYLEKWGVYLNEETAETAWQLGEGRALPLRILALEKGDIEKARKKYWDYIETYVCDQWDVELQEFVMEISIVDSFNVELAKMLTGKNNVEEIINRAEEIGNFFTETGEDGMWVCHLELRLAMRQCIQRRFSPQRIKQLYYNAGLYYELSDQIPKALEMYKKYDDMDSIARLLIANARRNPASGDYFSLRHYYLELPEEFIMKSPVLIAGMSMLQSILMNEEESERWYHVLEDYAGTHTGSQRREAKTRLFYLDVGLPHRGIVNMVDILKNIGRLIVERKMILPEFSVTSNLPSMMNGGKDFCEWSKRDNELAASIGKIVEFILGSYGKGLVPLALAESYFEKGMDSYEIVSLAEKGRMSAESGGKIEQCFVAVGILAWLAILRGNAAHGEQLLLSFEKKAREETERLLPNIRTFLCRCYMYQGRMQEVMEWMQEAPDEMMEFCSMERFRYLTKVRVYLQNGNYEQAYSLLQKLLYYADKMKRIYINMEAKLLLSILQYRIDNEEWKSTLQQCITEAEEYHFVRILSREGGALLELLMKGDFIWKDAEFQNQVMEECRQMAEYYPQYLREGTDGEIVLSENALKILQLQARGYSIKKIADVLGIAESTVKYHNKETYGKLGVNSKIAALNEARRRKLI